MTAVAVGAAPGVALAYSTGFFLIQNADGSADVFGIVVTPELPTAHHLDLVRGGAVIATSATQPSGSSASFHVANLLPGDVTRFYAGPAVRASASYDGLPVILADACAGHAAFTVTRTADHEVFDAGAFTPNSGSGIFNRAIFTSGNPFTVTLSQPLALGDVAFAVTQGLQSAGDVGVRSERDMTVGACPPAPVSPATPTAAPTDAQVLAKLRAAIAATGRRLKAHKTAELARRKRIGLPFALSEAGTVKLTITAPAAKKKAVTAKTVTIGSGSKSAAAAGTVTVTVKLTAAGRKLLKRARKVTLTLRGTFAPRRVGAKPQTASVRVRLKRK